MSGERVANDACEPLIALYRGWLQGWRPPSSVDETEYRRVKQCADLTDPLTAFVGFGCSFGGKYFGGYARDLKEGRDFVGTASRRLAVKLSRCVDVHFENCDFETLVIPDGALVYLDPPYRGTTPYGFFKSFDHDRFDAWALALSCRATVVRSEYVCPEPWREVASFDVRKSRFKGRQIEKLFQAKAE
jgi:DNA adenine methylase